MAKQSSPLSRSGQPAVPICAIGASAGGVSALQKLFRQLPDDLGLAYVVIVHLSPEHPSALAEILATCTEMRVHQVIDSPVLRPNSVYIIPPDRELVIDGDNIQAREFTEPRGRRAPVDVFFRSVASARGDGMAVVLSGAGADGSIGVRAIQEAGGVVFAQDPTEAEHPAMPQNAIATGVVSFVAPISRLAEHIVEVAKSKEAVRSLDEGGAANDLRRLITFLKARTGHDFSGYKRATVMRRVMRRMQVTRVTDLKAYGELVRTTPEEAQELFADLLISVTQFFRDETHFSALATKVISNFFEDTTERDDQLRVWSVGCATGEEAHSLAMLLLEKAERRKVRLPIQIFASDVDEGALATAREGRYPRSIEADVSEERLKRYFKDEGTHYRVRNELREIVLFASHSVLKDPPFIRLDLIACRNLMIYLERSLQEELLDLFHYSLKPNGILFLGSAETADISTQFFAPLDRDARIYQAKSVARRRGLPLPHPSTADPFRPQKEAIDTRREPATPIALHVEALEKHAPPSVLVDADHQILHISANAGVYIKHSAGTFSAKLPSVVRPELRLEVKTALNRVFDSGKPTLTHSMPTLLDGKRHGVAIQVMPAPLNDGSNGKVLVLFLDTGPLPPEGPTDDPAPPNGDQVRRLKTDLKAARESLIASRSEHETTIEDLRAANEELQSINEEYRSTSEELETSKEELQSINEELHAVNAELKTKLENILAAHNDLNNLTSATEVGTLFLNSQLRIRMVTPPIAELFNVTAMDLGRSITDFTHRLRYDDLEADARRVLRDLVPVEANLQSESGRWYMMRIRPYRTTEERIEGVVLTFVEITSLKEAERRLAESKLEYQTLFDAIDEAFSVLELIYDEAGNVPRDFRYLKVNRAFDRQTGLKEPVGRRGRELVPDLEDHWFETFGRIDQSREAERFEAVAAPLDRFFEAFAFPVGDAAQHRVGVLFRDISERKKAEEHQKLLTHELSHRVKNTLAVVQAIARQPAREDLTLSEYQDRFLGRIRALANAHDQLLASDWQEADLGDLVTSTMSAYRNGGQNTIRIAGLPVALNPRKALSLAMILHELATNAAKHGSLSVDDGTIAIEWAFVETPKGHEVCLTWQERNGPPVSKDAASGFGTVLIGKSVDYELDGKLEYHLDPEGLNVEVRFPCE